MNQQLSFIDVETTGLQPYTHEVIEVAVVSERPDGLSDIWSSKVAPSRLREASPVALELNGFTPEDWKDAPSIGTVALQVQAALKGRVAVGHNVSFDLDFLSALCVEAGGSKPGSWEEVLGIEGSIDTAQLVREHLFPTGLESASLDAVRKWLGIPMEGNHRALKDALDCQFVYGKLNRATALERKWWAIQGPRRMNQGATP